MEPSGPSSTPQTQTMSVSKTCWAKALDAKGALNCQSIQVIASLGLQWDEVCLAVLKNTSKLQQLSFC